MKKSEQKTLKTLTLEEEYNRKVTFEDIGMEDIENIKDINVRRGGRLNEARTKAYPD